MNNKHITEKSKHTTRDGRNKEQDISGLNLGGKADTGYVIGGSGRTNRKQSDSKKKKYRNRRRRRNNNKEKKRYINRRKRNRR